MGTFAVVLVSTAIAGFIRAWWESFKEAEAGKPVPMRFRKGVYEPYSRVTRIQAAMKYAVILWLIYIAALLVSLAYVKLIPA